MPVGEGISKSGFDYANQIGTIELYPETTALVVGKWGTLANYATDAQEDIRSSCPGANCNFTAAFPRPQDLQPECQMSCGNCDNETLRRSVNALGGAVQDIHLCQQLEAETGEVIEPASPSRLLDPDYIFTPVRKRLFAIRQEEYYQLPPVPKPRPLVTLHVSKKYL